MIYKIIFVLFSQDQVMYRIINSPLAAEYFYVGMTNGELYIQKSLAENKLNDTYRVSSGRVTGKSQLSPRYTFKYSILLLSTTSYAHAKSIISDM